MRNAISSLPGVKSIEIKMDAEVKRSAGPPTSNAIEGVAHIIAVSSGKGGVGKSTVAANLAVALAREGARVGLMDADFYGPNIPTMLGVTDRPTARLDSQKGEVLVPPIAHGVKVMSIGFLVEGDQPIVWRGPMLHSIVSQFCHKVDWGQLDYLIVDMPPGTGDVQLSLAQLVPVTGAILVTTPQEVSLQDVRKAFHMFEKVRIPIIGFVENMSWFKCGKCETRHFVFGSEGGVNLARKFKTELLAQLPIVSEVREGGDQGRPICLIDECGGQVGEVRDGFRELGRKVAQRVSVISVQHVSPAQTVEIGKFL